MQFNRELIGSVIKRKLNIIIDSTGIRCVGRSVWYCIRINKRIKKRDCDKIHVAADSDLHLLFVKCKRKSMRRKEVALRFIAYNVFIILCYNFLFEM